MARRVIWTTPMVEDLDNAADYIDRDSPRYASAFVREVRAAALTPRKLAYRGPMIPELNDPTIRELFVRNHRLTYKVEERRVVLLGLMHGARDFARAWKGRRQ